MNHDTPQIPCRLEEGACLPRRAHDTDAGADLCALWGVTVPRHGSAVIDTGAHVQLPHGTCGLLVSKSGLNVRCECTSTGLIDEGYTGRVLVRVYNHSDHDRHFDAGDKVSQIVVLPVLYPTYVEVDEITGGERGDAGYGSTGR